jgi:transglutaminase-like putative cysteine protease
VTAGSGRAETASPPPGDLERAPSSLVESDHAEIVARAREVAGDLPPRGRAERLERWVHQHVGYRGSGIGFATAVQTLRSRDGDCTEHATLLAALLRAAAVPSRLVVGLAWAQAERDAWRFVPHAWVEAWVDGAWLPLDAALYAPVVDATHLAMAKSAAADEGALLEISAPLLRGLGRFDLELVGTAAPRGAR